MKHVAKLTMGKVTWEILDTASLVIFTEASDGCYDDRQRGTISGIIIDRKQRQIILAGDYDLQRLGEVIGDIMARPSGSIIGEVYAQDPKVGMGKPVASSNLAG